MYRAESVTAVGDRNSVQIETVKRLNSNFGLI